MPIRALSVALLALAVAGCALSADDAVSAGLVSGDIDATLPDIGTAGSIDPVD